MPAGEIGRLETFLAKRFQERCINNAREGVFFSSKSKQQKAPCTRTGAISLSRCISGAGRADEFLPVPVQTPAAGHSLVYPIASLATSLVWVVPPLLLWWWFKVTPGKSSSSLSFVRSFAGWRWAQVVSAPPHLPLACMTTLLLRCGERQRKISHNNLPACWESVDVYYYKRALHLSLSLWTHYFYYLSCVWVSWLVPPSPSSERRRHRNIMLFMYSHLLLGLRMRPHNLRPQC